MSKKIIFMGTPEFSIPTLNSLIESDYQILAVYSQPPTKSNRGQLVNPSAIEKFAKKNTLNVRTPKDLDSDFEFNYFKSLKPDLVVVVAYGKIIPKRYLELANIDFINIHASLLPKWRGAAPIQRSIMNLDNETGISIMKIVEQLDAGPVLLQEKIKIDEKSNTKNISLILSELGAKNMIECIKKIEKNKIQYEEQDHNQASYAKKISKNESRIIWGESAKKILAKINALNPKPGAWFEHKNIRYKVWRAKIVQVRGNAGYTMDDELTIACSDYSIKVLEIQKEGKNKLLLEKFLIGNQIKTGQKIN